MRHTVQRKSRAAYWKYAEDVVTPTNNTTDEAHTSNKHFWSLFKHAKSDPSGIPSLKFRGQLVSDVATKASVLNDTFYTAFTRCHADSTLPSDTCSPYPSMPDISITTPGIEKLLKNLKPHKAAGPDNIQPMALKQLAPQIAHVLQKIHCPLKFIKFQMTGSQQRSVPYLKRERRSLQVIIALYLLLVSVVRS